MDRYIEVARRLITHLADQLQADFAVELWNGEVLPLGKDARTDLRLKIMNPEAITRLVRKAPLGKGFDQLIQLLADGSLRIEGGTLLDVAARRGSMNTKGLFKRLSKVQLARGLWPFLMRSLPKKEEQLEKHDYAGDIADKVEKGRDDKPLVQFHYDLSNAFYGLFLGPTMAYTCAYWPKPETTLDEAQTAKFDMICRKLRLQPGDRMLDIGSGWAGLICHAAQHYGVTAHGVTLAQEQYDFAQERIARLGLQDKVTVELKDYRDVTGSFDKIASIGMFEHVGLDNHDAYFRKIHSLLRPRGLYLHHAIARPAKRNMKTFRRKRPEFAALTRYIFPGGELDTVGMSANGLESHGFEVHDVEAWREHYARTTKAWTENLYARRDEAAGEVGEAKTRIWLLYLAGCSLAFERSAVGIFQTLASKKAKGPSGLPPTREDLYR
ncbi:cyclopropane-fatty-acyl-phospholipid synthase [Labrys miyagiensis]|uniref:Cyclopropane-fatty-acyl-phospholipid synthase n=1 Tax=Labrys miyagiensis TaxID=346912 RepID=A0ABQ6CNI4_9HYPH|nr:cyclopropane-fatty-acyl-phospholipid synthase family protein [Labrys miyagiensis]GLS21323.1 cyclopropane-fatty-acyl-phospholipid synthase [Labrys miyagiensis]